MFLSQKTIPKTNEKKEFKGLQPTPKVSTSKVASCLAFDEKNF